MDAIFEAEQAHLTEAYGKLQNIADTAKKALESRIAEAIKDKGDMKDELALDFTGEVNVETWVEIEHMQRIIDQYNLANDLDNERMTKAHSLMKQPYFAKVTLKFPSGAPRDIYIGSTGMTDENRRHFIVDWRSPVAEVYYNQANGKTSYEANGRTINCELTLRRQFDITRDKLNDYFDTTVAIEDPLLLASLQRRRTASLQDITATIQKEQNVVVRHKDVPVLLVNGIAGSGKTSVLLQRIAYLLFQQRDNLDAKDVYLITPNPVFAKYIDEVLPSMGESNPRTVTWKTLMAKLGLGERGLSKDTTAENLRAIDAMLPTLELDAKDFQDIKVGKERVILASQARSAYMSYKRIPAGPHRAALTAEELHDRLEQRINRLCRDEDVQDEMMDLDLEEQIRIFGHQVQALNEEELRDYTRTYLIDRYKPVVEAIDDGKWLRIDRIGMRMLNKGALSSDEWLYLKLALAGGNNRFARYVMIDEVQDYTAPQLMVLARYFSNAHFLLLGDENQAIKPGTVTFPQIHDIFASFHDQVCDCELMTSYRSSPEITKLFTSLMTEDERIKTNSVQRPGTEPSITAYADQDAYNASLLTTVDDAIASGELVAIVAADEDHMRRLGKQLSGKDIMVMDGTKPLPTSGVVLLSIALAKGLEFDQVIIPDASEARFDESDLSRHRLYTAISRATQKVTLLANGNLTKLLG